MTKRGRDWQAAGQAGLTVLTSQKYTSGDEDSIAQAVAGLQAARARIIVCIAYSVPRPHFPPPTPPRAAGLFPHFSPVPPSHSPSFSSGGRGAHHAARGGAGTGRAGLRVADWRLGARPTERSPTELEPGRDAHVAVGVAGSVSGAVCGGAGRAV
eukprot:2666576-Rhodomonas_salina.1